MAVKIIKRIECRGTPYEIGYTHGSGAAEEVERCIAFYADLFMKYSKLEWTKVRETAKSFDTAIRAKWPRYHQELQGIADGSKREILDIVAINVRTEIAFGLFSDGCTSLFWRTPENVFLGQNWDWMEEQKQNLIILSVYQDKLPSIKMVTEAGMVGKIGFNSAGVGVCFNAIRAKGLDASRMPVHLGLRTVLESSSLKDAIEKLEEAGMSASAHMLIGDGAGDAIGLEFTSSTFAKIPVNPGGQIVHSNHFLVKHEGFGGPVGGTWLKDSPERVEQMTALVERIAPKQPSWEDFSRVFEDQKGYPAAICRAQEGVSTSATLFNIVMDLKAKKGVVKMGRPCDVEDVIELSFD